MRVNEAVYRLKSALNKIEVTSVSDPSDNENRMLLSKQENTEADDTRFGRHGRRRYGCRDCEETWDTLCNVGLADVCSINNDDSVFTDDAKTSINNACKKIGRECRAASAKETCDGLCKEVPEDACSLNPCENGGSCSLDPAGGHVCSCATNYGGMTCQIDTSLLDKFSISAVYSGSWTRPQKVMFESAADRWSKIITHVPCRGRRFVGSERPRQLVIQAKLEEMDELGGMLGRAGPRTVWDRCNTIARTGEMVFDIDDINNLETFGNLESLFLHEMGHVIGVRSLWGEGFGECTTCDTTGRTAWTCSAAISAYDDIGGSDTAIVELDGSDGTKCGELDEKIFGDEMMTGYVMRGEKPRLSKMTAAVLDDLKYIVDPSAVDSYALPAERDIPSPALADESMIIHDVAVDAMIIVVNRYGKVVKEKRGVSIQFRAT